jgi:thymidine phosphorylase
LPESARELELAESIVDIANRAGLPARALVTDMDQVLGRSVGNAVAEMLQLGGLCETLDDGRAMALACLADGRAAEKFARMVTALGGPGDFIERAADYLPCSGWVRPCLADQSGYIAAMDCRQIGICVVNPGSGRRRAGDNIDPAVGITDVCPIGSYVAANEPLAMVHAANEADGRSAVEAVRRAILIEDAAPRPTPIAAARIAGSDHRRLGQG